MMLFEVAQLLIRMNQSGETEAACGGRYKWFECAYSDMHQRVLVMPREGMPLLYAAHDPEKWREDELGFSGFFLGFLYLASGDIERAIEEEEFALRYQDHLWRETRPNLSHNLACAYSKFGKMELAAEACKRAISLGVDHRLTLDDPDLSDLRQHPLWAEILKVVDSTGAN